MKRFLPLLLLAAPLFGDQLDSTSFTQMGYFALPSELALGAHSISYASDCMGETDPSPSDGYPGCIIATLKTESLELGVGDPAFRALGSVMMVDIPEPDLTGTNTASEVLGEWEVTDFIQYTNGYTGGWGRHEFHVYYDTEASPCRIIWAYYLEYGTSPADDDLVFGYSDCDATTPNAQGMWRFDIATDADVSNSDPYRSTKWIYDITKIPSGIADDYFDGDRMLLGPGKSFGSRGSSLGPSIGVRPWTFPTDSNGWDDFSPLVYYNSSIGYSRWYVDSKFRGATDAQASFVSAQSGQDVIRITVGATDYEAAFTVGSRSVVLPDEYPLNDANAKPTESPWDVGSETYQSPGAYGWPDPDVVPVEWYGVESYNPGIADLQNPSFTDDCTTSNCGETRPGSGVFTRMPMDSNLVSTCSHGTGPSSQAQNTFIYLYDLPELGELYDGVSGYGPEELQPYEEVNVSIDLDNDGWDLRDSCAQIGRQKGVTVDRETSSDYNYVYFSHATGVTGASVPYTSGSEIGISVYRVEPPTGHTPDPTGADSELEGGGIEGGGIG